jgi:LDH2 family malate/lactate/ureidoglycolate dehydrogenase
VLPGGHATWKVGSWIFDPPSQPSWHNASFIALDVASISSPEAFDSRLQTLIDEIHRASTAAGVDRLLLPGEREWQNAGRARDAGIEIPPDVLEKLRSCSRLTQVTAPWLDSQSILSPSDKAEA